MKNLLRWYGGSEESEIPSLPIECGCMPHPYIAGLGLSVEQNGPTIHCLQHMWMYIHMCAVKEGPTYSSPV